MPNPFNFAHREKNPTASRGILSFNKKIIARFCLSCALYFLALPSLAQIPPPGGDGFGQTLQIHTRLHSFVGKPSWLLMIRDLDHADNVPYLFDITRGEDAWVAFTYGRNYLITASTLQIETYNAKCNSFKTYKIRNFCHLESHGRIQRGESMSITISGHLSANSDGYTCNISKFTEPNFVIVPDP